jgi:Flp pilus assembly protein TadG
MARRLDNAPTDASEARMNRSLAIIVAALGVALAAPAASLAATAATTSKAAKKPAAKAPLKNRAARAAAPAAPALDSAGDEQKAAAGLAHLGDYACEFDQTVKVGVNPLAPGYIDVAHKAQTWVMRPVVSSTGALRLEDVKGRMLMIQIANKSMLMDTQIGQRLVDGCQHEKQREFERALKGQPAADALLK